MEIEESRNVKTIVSVLDGYRCLAAFIMSMPFDSSLN